MKLIFLLFIFITNTLIAKSDFYISFGIYDINNKYNIHYILTNTDFKYKEPSPDNNKKNLTTVYVFDNEIYEEFISILKRNDLRKLKWSIPDFNKSKTSYGFIQLNIFSDLFTGGFTAETPNVSNKPNYRMICNIIMEFIVLAEVACDKYYLNTNNVKPLINIDHLIDTPKNDNDEDGWKIFTIDEKKVQKNNKLHSLETVIE